MALVSSGSLAAPVPKSNPTATLAQELSTFENALDDRQKREYQKQSSKPDADAVVAFVSQLDRQSSGRAGRCVASRLFTFLKATQQFSDVVDTFVSSKPTLAALIWGGVKFAILAASNVSSYFEKVSHFIMTIGRTCPTYQEFGSLYPGDAGLQTALCDYYAVVVRLCTKIVEVSQRSGLKQLFLPIISPFETEFSSHRDDLKQSTELVHSQISLASKKLTHKAAQLAKVEREANSSHRWQMSLFQKRTMQKQDEDQDWRVQTAWRDQMRMRDELRANLAPVDHTKAWKQSLQQRVCGTGTWFECDPQFCNWLADPNSAVIWFSGTLGTGKTVFTSSVVAYIHARRESHEITSYFFCQSEEGSSLLGRNILGSITCQLLSSHIEALDNKDLSKISRSGRNLDVDGVVDFLMANLEAKYTYFVILDGLDECESQELASVSRALHSLCQRREICVKVFCTGRPDLERKLFCRTKPSFKIRLRGEEVRKDIETYVRINLEQRLADERLILGDPTLIIRIANVLETGARGMFLWARLLLDEICSKNSDKEIIASLNDLPTELTDLFSRILRRVKLGSNATRATRVLQLCAVSKRPLEIEELREALTVEKGQQSLDRQGLPNDMTRVLDGCCGLTFLNEEENTVHLVHDSVKQHLFRGDSSFEATTFKEPALNENLGILCMTYLNFNDFNQQLTKFAPKSTAVIDPIRIGLATIQNKSQLSAQIAQTILRRWLPNDGVTQQNVERQMRDALGARGNLDPKSTMEVNQFTFLPYARQYWIHHLNGFENSDGASWRLFCRCVESEEIIPDRPWTSALITDANIGSGFDEHTRWAIENDNLALFIYSQKRLKHEISAKPTVELLIRCASRGKTRIAELLINTGTYSQDSMDWAVVAAAEGGHLDVVERLLIAEADVNAAAAAAGMGRTALQAAAEGGHLDVVERLLTAKANVNAAAADVNGQTALQAAAEGGHLDVVERLLTAKADVNTAPAARGRTALQAAAEGGHLDVVERLLIAKADVNAAASRYGRTTLQAAAEGGHLDVVERLLTAKADVNAAPAAGGRTALQAAAQGGHLNVVERLLTAKADVNAAASRYGRTTLQAAAEGGHLDVVERLLTAKADVNAAPAAGGRTALQAAAEGGHLDVVERLLTAKADVNAAPAAGGRTALQAATQGGHLDVVERLLTAKANVNAAAADVYGRTALQAAAEGGHLDVVERLLTAKADVNAAPAAGGRTALQAATQGGHLDVVERLLTAKANVNAAAADVYGRTALQAAAEGGHLDVVERLLTAKADVNAAPAAGGRTALQAATQGGHLDVVERLLTAKADVNAAPAAGGRTALQAAAQGGHLDVVERLLTAKADVNAAAAGGGMGRTALQAAARGGHLDVVERLLTAKADVNAAPAAGGRTALQAAAEGGHLDVVERLLTAKADVNAAAAGGGMGRTALQAAARGGHLDVVERLLTAKADVNAAPAAGGRTALQAAAQGGHLDVVERLLTAKADVNAAASRYGRTTLQAAARGGHLDVVERLLTAKADVNAAAADVNGQTALQAAAEGGHLDVVERLLTAKADVNAAAAGGGMGRTALQAAARGGHLDVVERLLTAKADVNAAPAAGGRTALQAAAQGGHLDVVERLLTAKADVNAAAADVNGQTALQAAVEGGYELVIERLKKAGAK